VIDSFFMAEEKFEFGLETVIVVLRLPQIPGFPEGNAIGKGILHALLMTSTGVDASKSWGWGHLNRSVYRLEISDRLKAIREIIAAINVLAEHARIFIRNDSDTAWLCAWPKDAISAVADSEIWEPLKAAIADDMRLPIDPLNHPNCRN
jgi:hypothetical protein